DGEIERDGIGQDAVRRCGIGTSARPGLEASAAAARAAGTAHPGALPTAGDRTEDGAAPGVPSPARGPATRRGSGAGDRGREGAHRLLRALLQHRRGRPALDLLVAETRWIGAVRGRVR